MRASQWSRGLADDAPAPRTATGRRLTLRATVQAIGALDVRATRVICTPCATDSTAQSTKQRLVGRKRQGFSHWFGTEAVMDAREFFQKVVVPRYTKFVRRRRSRPLPRPLPCPICKSPAQELDRTGDATGFDCPMHGKFKVANTIVAEECNRRRWEAALRKAKLRANPWEVPLVMSGDLFW